MPETADKREVDISTKLAADLFASIGKPSLAIEYKHNLHIAYAQLGQRNLEQLVLIEFLVCMRKEHANDVSPETGIMGGDSNTIHLVTKDNVEYWPPQSKDEVASALIQRIAAALAERK